MPDKQTEKRGGPNGFRRGLFLAIALFFVFLHSASAVILTVEISVLFYPESNPFPQNGGLAQLVLYNQGEYSLTSDNKDAGSQFTQYGTYDGQPTYLPDTSPENTKLFMTVGFDYQYIDGWGLLGIATFNFVIDTELYDSFYIRVFDTTVFPETPELIPWGIVDGDTFMAISDGIQYAYGAYEGNLNQTNYFEVIPEPTTCGLIGLGWLALLGHRRRRTFANTSGCEKGKAVLE